MPVRTRKIHPRGCPPGHVELGVALLCCSRCRAGSVKNGLSCFMQIGGTNHECEVSLFDRVALHANHFHARACSFVTTPPKNHSSTGHAPIARDQSDYRVGIAPPESCSSWIHHISKGLVGTRPEILPRSDNTIESKFTRTLTISTPSRHCERGDQIFMQLSSSRRTFRSPDTRVLLHPSH